MPLSNTDSEIMMLYEVASLSDELRDEGAKVLLQWAEKQVEWLAEREKSGTGSDEAFQEQLVTLHRLMKRAGKLVGRWQDLSPEEQHERMAKLVETGRELGYQVDENKVDAIKQAGVTSEQEGIQALLEMFATQSSESAMQPETPSPESHSPEPRSPETMTAQADFLADVTAADTSADTEDDDPDVQSPEWQ